MTFLRKLALNGLTALFGIAFALLALEAAFRLWPKPAQQSWSDRPAKYFRHESAQTLQDYPHAEKKPANTFRIAVVGDSYSFAPYMQFTDSFPKKLEQMLNLNTVRTKAEVINYGVPAYSTSHEVAMVERAIKEQADLILLQITLNDAEVKSYRPTGITNFARFGAYQPPPHWQAILSYWSSLMFVLERLHNTHTHREYIKYFNDLFKNPIGWKLYARANTQIAKLTKENKVKIVALIFPLFGLELDDEYPFFPIHKKIGDLMRQLEIPYLDLYKAYQGLPLERLQVIPGTDRHPNEIAHRIAAEQIYDWLAAERYLPQELVVRRWFAGRTDIIREEPL